MNQYLKEKVRTAFERPIEYCEMKRAWCRFAIVGYCLQEFGECDYWFPGEIKAGLGFRKKVRREDEST